jgi:hypothetical protein
MEGLAFQLGGKSDPGADSGPLIRTGAVLLVTPFRGQAEIASPPYPFCGHKCGRLLSATATSGYLVELRLAAVLLVTESNTKDAINEA